LHSLFQQTMPYLLARYQTAKLCALHIPQSTTGGVYCYFVDIAIVQKMAGKYSMFTFLEYLQFMMC